MPESKQRNKQQFPLGIAANEKNRAYIPLTKLFQLSRDFSDSVPFKAKVKHEKQNVDSERKHGVEYDTRAKDSHELFFD